MSELQQQRRVDWGHMLLIAFFAVITIAYLTDAWMASPKVRNLVLVLPASILSLVLCVIVAWSSFRSGADDDSTEAAESRSTFDRFKPALLMALFALYVLTVPWLGFDVGSALFVAAALLLDGERRIVLLAAVSIIFSCVATLVFHWLLPYPMPLLLM